METDEDYVLQALGGVVAAEFAESRVPLLHLQQAMDISAEVQSLRDKIQEMGQHLATYCSGITQAAHRFVQPGWSTMDQSQFDKEILEEFHLLGSQEFTENWSAPHLSSKLEEYISHLSTLQSRLITEELNIYKRENQLSQHGTQPFTKNLGTLQPLCEGFLDLYFLLQGHLEKLKTALATNSRNWGQFQPHPQFEPGFIPNVEKHLISMLKILFNNCLIVEQQPPQVMKTKTRFPLQVRLRFLLGLKLNRKMICSTAVKAVIITELQAKELVLQVPSIEKSNSLSKQLKPAGVLSNYRVKLDAIKSSSHSPVCVAPYRNLQLKKIDRETKKVKGQVSSPSMNKAQQGASSINSPAASVTDEKFCLMFQMGLKIGPELIEVWTLSLPVVVVTHGVQDSQGWATVIWDNYFSSPERLPFEVPDSVPWTPLAQILNKKFSTSTGKGLDGRQLLILKSRLLTDDNKLDSSGDVLISFSRFCKEPMPGVSICFWEWFHNCLKLIEKHGQRSWRTGAIFGFVGRSKAEALLEGMSPGTFLLRFSDSVLGGISVCYVASNGTVFSLSPFTTKNLTFRSLTDSVWDLDNLTTVYPNTPKAKAFPNTNRGGYSACYMELRAATPSTCITKKQKSDYVTSFPKISIPNQFL